MRKWAAIVFAALATTAGCFLFPAAEDNAPFPPAADSTLPADDPVLRIAAAPRPLSPWSQAAATAEAAAALGFNVLHMPVEIDGSEEAAWRSHVEQWRGWLGRGLRVLPEIRGGYVDPMIDHQGRRLQRLWIGCFDSAQNRQRAGEACRRLAAACLNGPNPLAAIQGVSLIALWGDAAYWHHSDDSLACYCPHSREAFLAWLRDEVYRDTEPGRDTNHDGRYFTRQTGVRAVAWNDLQLPRPVHRQSHPYYWHLFMRFRQRSIQRFFQEVQAGLEPLKVALVSYEPGRSGVPNECPYWGTDLASRFQAVRVPAVGHSHPDHPATWLSLAHAATLGPRRVQPWLQWLHVADATALGWLAGATGDHTGPPEAPAAASQRTGRFYTDVTLDAGYLARAMGLALGSGADGVAIEPAAWISTHRSELEGLVRYWNALWQTHGRLLSQLEPVRPAVAVMIPWTSGVFDPAGGSYHKHAFLWGAQLLQESHLAVAVVSEEDVADGRALEGIKVLYLFGCDRVPEPTRIGIERFHRAGGWVFADSNSLASTIDQPSDRLHRRVLGLALQGTKWPATIEFPSGSERLMGIDRIQAQRPVFVCRPEGAYVAGTCANQPAAVWTQRTLWIGCAVGHEAFLSSPVDRVAGELRQPGERPASCAAHDKLRHLTSRLADWAAVRPVADVRCRPGPTADGPAEGAVAGWIQVLLRTHPRTGLRWYTFINHEPQALCYTIGLEGLKVEYGWRAWDLLNDRLIEDDTDGRFELAVPARGVSMVVVGRPGEVEAVAAAQRHVLKAAATGAEGPRR